MTFGESPLRPISAGGLDRSSSGKIRRAVVLTESLYSTRSTSVAILVS